MKMRSYAISLTMSTLLGVVSCSKSPQSIQNPAGTVGTVGQARQPADPVATMALAQTQPETTVTQPSNNGRPNIVMLMTDDTGWNDFGAYSGGGAALGHPTPNIDRIAKEGAVFTNWYGQASCTAGRASFITGRVPIRSALSIVVAPG